jgi:hypothetical protein
MVGSVREIVGGKTENETRFYISRSAPMPSALQASDGQRRGLTPPAWAARPTGAGVVLAYEGPFARALEARTTRPHPPAS